MSHREPEKKKECGGREACLQCGKVDDTVDGGVLGKHLVQGLLVGDVDLVEVGSAASQQFDTVEGHFGRVVEAVDNDDIVAGIKQGQSREGANVARSTANCLSVEKPHTVMIASLRMLCVALHRTTSRRKCYAGAARTAAQRLWQ